MKKKVSFISGCKKRMKFTGKVLVFCSKKRRSQGKHALRKIRDNRYKKLSHK